jgi:hypothetical protein
VPRRGVRSPPGQELLGVATSHGPSRESYRSSRKSRGGTAEASGTPATARRCLLKGCEQRFHPRQARHPLLQRALSGGSAEMLAVEGTSAVPGDDVRQEETERAKPALSGARPGPGTALETGTRFNPEILIRRRLWPYIQPVRCNWSFISSTGAGSTCECAIRRGSGDC